MEKSYLTIELQGRYLAVFLAEIFLFAAMAAQGF